MGLDFPRKFRGLGFLKTLKRWQHVAKHPADHQTSELTRVNNELRGFRDRLDRISASARSEIRNREASNDLIDRPEQCDWASRPLPWRVELVPDALVGFDSGTEFAGGVTLFHDGERNEISIRQEATPERLDLGGYSLILETYDPGGSFVSLVQDFPAGGLDNLTLSHFISVQVIVEQEQPADLYVRLNVQHGPNLEQILRKINLDGNKGTAEFDLAYSKINQKRIEKAWFDLIIEKPRMNKVSFHDMVVLRAPRADV